jgi:hypothetical protein
LCFSSYYFISKNAAFFFGCSLPHVPPPLKMSMECFLSDCLVLTSYPPPGSSLIYATGCTMRCRGRRSKTRNCRRSLISSQRHAKERPRLSSQYAFLSVDSISFSNLSVYFLFEDGLPQRDSQPSLEELGHPFENLLRLQHSIVPRDRPQTTLPKLKCEVDKLRRELEQKVL